jgi:hypothetical protein
VTNGYESVETLNYLGPHLDAANIDLKSFSEAFYSRICGGHLDHVCATIPRCAAMGIHTEVTTLVIPGENDGSEELRGVAEFLASVDPAIVWHVSAYHDDYNFSGRGPEGHLHGRTITKCPRCGTVLVEREWGSARLRMKGGVCKCGEVVPGIFEDARNLPRKLDRVPAEPADEARADASGFGENAVLFAGRSGRAKRIAEAIGERLGFVVVNLATVSAPIVLEFREASVACAKNLEARLRALGFTEVAPLGDRDQEAPDPDASLEKWVAKVAFS